MTRYMTPPHMGCAFTHRALSKMVCNDLHRWVFAYNMAPDVETPVRKWLTIRLDGFYCDLQVMYAPHVITRARDAAKAVIKATGLNPHTNRCGWPSCLVELDWNENEEGAI